MPGMTAEQEARIVAEFSPEQRAAWELVKSYPEVDDGAERLARELREQLLIAVAMAGLQAEIDELGETADRTEALTRQVIDRAKAAEAERDQLRRDLKTMQDHAADLAAALASKG